MTINGNGRLSWRWLAGLLLAVAGFFLVATVNRVGQAETENHRQDREITEVRTNAANLGNQLSRIEAKLDRLIERRDGRDGR